MRARKQAPLSPPESPKPSDFPKWSWKWYKAHTQQEKDDFESSIIGFLFYCIMLGFALSEPVNTKYYYRFHGGVFIGIVLYVLWLIVVRASLKQRFIGFVDLFRTSSWGLNELGDGIGLFGAMFALFCLFFVIDTSFFIHDGLKISGVVGVALFKILKDVASTFKKPIHKR